MIPLRLPTHRPVVAAEPPPSLAAPTPSRFAMPDLWFATAAAGILLWLALPV